MSPTLVPSGGMIQLDEVNHISAIASLPTKEKAGLLNRLKRRVVLTNRLLVKKGEKGTTMYFINWGSAKVRTNSGSSQEMIVALLGPGNYFGEIGMITSRPRSFDVITLEKTEVFELSRNDFIQHTQAFRAFSISLLVAIAGRLDDSARRIQDLSEQHIPTRLWRVLSQLAQPKMIGGNRLLVIDPRPTQYDLIGLVGAPRERVYDALRDMERTGLVILEKSRIILHPMPGKLT